MKKTFTILAVICGFLGLVGTAAPVAAQITGLQTVPLAPGHAYRNNVAFDSVNGVYLVIVQRPPVIGRFLDRDGVQIGQDFVIANEPGNPFTAWASVTFGGPPSDPTFLVTYIEATLENNPKWARFVRFVPGSAPTVSARRHVVDVFTEWHTAEKAQNAWDGEQFIIGSRLRATVSSLPRPVVSRIDLAGNVSAPRVLGDTVDFYGMPSVACASNAVCMVMGFAAGIPAGYAGGSYAQLFQAGGLTPLGALFLLASGHANEDQGVVYQAHTGRFLTHWARYSAGTGYIDTRLVGTDGTLSALDLSRGIGGPGAGANAISYNAGTQTTLLVTKGDVETGPLIVMQLGDDGYPVNAANTVLITEWDFQVLDYVPGVTANPVDGEWLVTADLAAAGVSRLIQGVIVESSGQPPSISTSPNLPKATQAVPYSLVMGAFAGVAPYTWSLVSGALPPGITLSSGILTGTPTNSGTFNFRLRATDSEGDFAERDFTLVVIATIVVTTTNNDAHIDGGNVLSLYPGHAYRNNVAFDPVNGVYLVIVRRPPVTGRFLDRNGNQIGQDFVIATESGDPFTAWASVTFGGPPNDPTFLVTYIEATLETNPKWGRLVRFVPGSAPNVGPRRHIVDVFTEWHTAEKAQNVWDGQQFIVGSRLRATTNALPRPVVHRFDMNGNVSAPSVLGDTADFYGMPSVACASNAVCMVMGFAAGIPAGYAGGSYAQLFNANGLTAQGSLFLLASGNANEDQGVVYQTHTGRFLTHWARYSNGTGYIDTRLVGTDGSLSILDLSKGIGGPGAGANAIAYNAGTQTTLLVTKGDVATGPLIVMELGDNGYPVNASNTVLITEWDFQVLDYVPSVAANPVDGHWLVTADLAAAGVGRIIHGTLTSGSGTTGPGPASRGIHLNGDGFGDAFVYHAGTGQWGRQNTESGGGFLSSNGGWAPGWTVVPGAFDGDDLSDVFLFSTTMGQWYKLLNDGNGFTVQSNGSWWPGWQRYVMDLDGDSISDVFLYDPVSGQWYKCISTPTGFTYYFGGWNPNWEIYPADFNGDALGDMFLINGTTGQWFWVLGAAGADFTYPVSSGWAPGWKPYVGDFNGDGFDDLLIHRPSNGQFYVAINNGAGFTYHFGAWSLGWTPLVVNLDGNSNDTDDLFLYNKDTGEWFQLLSNGSGQFTAVGSGYWSTGWDVYATDYNADGRDDLLLYNPANGQFYQAWNLSLGSFVYHGGAWNTGLTIVVGGR